MSEEWGPWIEHDGKGCPVEGKWVHVTLRNGHELQTVAGRSVVDANGNFRRGFSLYQFNSWVWSDGGPEGNKVVRYRVRKPRALQQLRDMIADLPVKEPA